VPEKLYRLDQTRVRNNLTRNVGDAPELGKPASQMLFDDNYRQRHVGLLAHSSQQWLLTRIARLCKHG
jgi:hypothetical protein